MDRGYLGAERFDGAEYLEGNHRPLWERKYDYRDDEEIYVDDQSCKNCALHHRSCPIEITEYDCPRQIQWKKKLESEDAVHKDGRVIWCVNWKQKKGSKRR
jgi:hypothetical protein